MITARCRPDSFEGLLLVRAQMLPASGALQYRPQRRPHLIISLQKSMKARTLAGTWWRDG
jgi:hypothetical protein